MQVVEGLDPLDGTIWVRPGHVIEFEILQCTYTVHSLNEFHKYELILSNVSLNFTLHAKSFKMILILTLSLFLLWEAHNITAVNKLLHLCEDHQVTTLGEIDALRLHRVVSNNFDSFLMIVKDV